MLKVLYKRTFFIYEERAYPCMTNQKDLIMKKLSKLLMACSCFTLFSLPVMAEEVVQKPAELRANFRRIGLELSSTKVSNAKEYENSPVTQLNADNQSLIKGVFDFVLEYDNADMRWDNSLFMNYGRTKIKGHEDGDVSETSENEDKILLTTDYAYKMWKYRDMDLGPFTSVAYQTEFTRNEDAPRMKVFRGKGGIKLFSGKIVKELYVAGVGEYDITYSDNVSKFAAETGWRLEHKLRDGVQVSTDGYFRKYFTYSQYIGTDLKYDLNLTARMDVDITETLTFGPYVSYRLAQSREAESHASNLMIGVSLSYKNLYQLFQ